MINKAFPALKNIETLSITRKRKILMHKFE
jgi:hypothetical protein